MESEIVRGVLFVCLFLMGLCAIEHHFRLSRLPYVSWVVLFGIAYGALDQTLVPALPDIKLTPDVVLYLFLPVLIFDSSRKLDLGTARTEALPAFLLATLGIIISMLAMAVPLRFLTGLPWNDVLFFSAIMSATDPVAVTTVFKQFPVPERLRTLIEGESLINDGTTIILFMLLSGKVLENKTILLNQGILYFLLSIGIAILLGTAMGWIGAFLVRWWKALEEHFIGTLLPLLVVYLTFCLAQSLLEISGVIAVMSATFTMRILYRRFRPEDIPVQSDIAFYAGFWDFFAELANALLFFMLGVEISLHYHEINWWVMPGVIAAMLLARSVVVYGAGIAFRLVGVRLPLPWQHVLNLGGLRGALSVALILMIPETYAYRNLFLCAALVLSFFTLIANPLALRGYLKKAKLDA